MSVDSREFRDTIGLFATGVVIVVTEVRDQVHAMTANAVCSVSLEPPTLLFCPGKKARLSRHLPDMRRYTLNVLREEQQALSSYFAGAWKDSPAPPFRFVPSPAGPRLEGALASIGCDTERIVDAFDHWIVLGRVLSLHRGVGPHRPLLFLAGRYRELGAEQGTPAPDLTQVEDEPPQIFYSH
jgi:3-hydroxy-9,10-secoandrosta-1,3,5(10)-triene-9,17-dione monooxygenase reductase component